jgi:hypothetical protein
MKIGSEKKLNKIFFLVVGLREFKPGFHGFNLRV